MHKQLLVSCIVITVVFAPYNKSEMVKQLQYMT